MGAVIHIQNKYKSKGIENILKIEIYLHNFCKPFYNVFLLFDFASIYSVVCSNLGTLLEYMYCHTYHY